MKTLTDDAWAAAHHAEAKAMLRCQLLQAVRVHLPFASQPGFLTEAEIADQLIILAAAIPSLVKIAKVPDDRKAGAIG